MSVEFSGFVDAVAEFVELHGPDEQHWFADWCADFDDAQRECDNGRVTLLLDALIAFNAWLCDHGRNGARP